jgi:hypothetical protein
VKISLNTQKRIPENPLQRMGAWKEPGEHVDEENETDGVAE